MAEGKRARVSLEASAEKPRLDLGNGKFVAATPLVEVSDAGRKTASHPYVFYKWYSIPKCEEYPQGAKAFACNQKDCKYVAVEKEGEPSIKSNLKNHLERVHFKDPLHTHLLTNGQMSETNQVKNSVAEYVTMIASSGMPYYKFTQAGIALKEDLNRFGVVVCSPNTFRKTLNGICQATIANMFEDLRGSIGHIITDASPSKVKKEYVDFTIFFFNKEDRWKTMCLGSRQVLGALDTSRYGQVIDKVCELWGARLVPMAHSLVPGETSIGEHIVTEFLIASSCTDMGPGAHGALIHRLGSNIHLPCCAHGMNGIVRDSIGISEEISKAYEALEDFTKTISSTQKAREILAGKGIGVPPKTKKIRWNSYFRLLDYFLTNAVALTAAYPAAAEINFDLISMVHALLSPLAKVVDELQTQAPGDTIVVPIMILQALKMIVVPSCLERYVLTPTHPTAPSSDRMLRRESLNADTCVMPSWQHVDKVRKAIIRKILRRFFDGTFTELESQYNIYEEKSIRRWNILKNELVLGTFACLPTPYRDFSFIWKFGLMTQNHADVHSLKAAALEAAKKIINRASEVQPRQSAPTTIFTSALPLPEEPDDDAAATEVVVGELTSLAKNAAVNEAFTNLLSKTFCKANREKLCTVMLSVAPRTSNVGKLLRIVLSKPLTTVKAETNFGFVQGLLNESRLSMGTKTLTGYYMVNLNKAWVAAPPLQISEEKPRNTTLDTFFKSSSGHGALGTSYAQDFVTIDDDDNPGGATIDLVAKSSPQLMRGNQCPLHTPVEAIMREAIMRASPDDRYEENPVYEEDVSWIDNMLGVLGADDGEDEEATI